MNRTAYVHGSAARKTERDRRPMRGQREERKFRTVQGGLAAARPSRKTTVLHLLFMLGALVVTALALYQYVNVQTSLEGSVTTIASLEKELAALRQENDEAYSRANSTIDLEVVKQVAIQELGMKYADEGQIITYSDDGARDYVRQLAEIPEAEK